MVAYVQRTCGSRVQCNAMHASGDDLSSADTVSLLSEIILPRMWIIGLRIQAYTPLPSQAPSALL
jgi:hypothetical protein